MVALADIGGGSSRFISNSEEMEKTFGSELDRMVVPVARNLEMTLDFLVDVDVLETWGYENRRTGNRIRYFLPTLHHGDYETILIQLWVHPQRYTGPMDIACFSIRYEDMYGTLHKSGPHTLQASFVQMPYPVTGFTDGKVLYSGTAMHFAQNLKKIGELYYSHKSEATLQRALDLTLNTKKEILNARMRLDSRGFDDHIDILNRYIEILGQELDVSYSKSIGYMDDMEMAVQIPGRSVHIHLENLCNEIVLDLQKKNRGVVAVCGFASQRSGSDQLTDLLNEMAISEITRIRTITLVDQNMLSATFRNRGISLRSLSDKLNAIEAGKLLKADYIMTGTVMETTNTIIIFSRLLNVWNGEVESTAQVIVTK
jgi:TolB-like protein